MKTKNDLREFAELTLLEKYSPLCIVVDNEGEIKYIHGKTGKVLENTTGEPTNNIISLAKDGLKIPLSNAIRRSFIDKGEVVYDNIKIKGDSCNELVSIVVSPVAYPLGNINFLLVVFDLKPVKSEIRKKRKSNQTDANSEYVVEIEKELKETQEYLYHTISELEKLNEKVKSSNDEGQSSNKVLQSINEELETSKDEIQSVKEELLNSNSELQKTIHELTKANNDISNLLNNTEIATIYLDLNLCVFQYTESVKKLFLIQQGVIGVSIGRIPSVLEYKKLEDDSMEVLKSLAAKEFEINSNDGSIYWTSIHPYKTAQNTIAGIVLTFINITEKKNLDEEHKNTYAMLETSLEQTGAGIIIVGSSDNKIRFMNKACQNILLINNKIEFLEKPINNIPRSWQITNTDNVLIDIEDYPLSKAIRGVSSKSQEQKIIRSDGTERWVLTAAEPVFDNAGIQIAGFVLFYDITEQKKSQEIIKKNEECFHTLADTTQDGIIIKEGGKVIYANKKICEIYGIQQCDCANFDNLSFVAPEDRERVRKENIEVEKNKANYKELSYWIIRKDGLRRYLNNRYSFSVSSTGNKTCYIITSDITKKYLTDYALKMSEERFRNLAELLPETIYESDSNGQLTFVNTMGIKTFGYNIDELRHNFSIIDFIAPYHRSRALENRNKTINDNIIQRIEYDVIRKNGEIFPSIIHTAPIFKGAEFIGTRGIVVDISVLKAKEKSILQINRIYEILSSINQVILLAKNEEELFQEVCKTAVIRGKFKFSWIGIIDSKNKVVTPAFQYGESDDYLNNIVVKYDESAEGKGATGKALRLGKTQVIGDFLSDPNTKPWQKQAAKSKFRSSASVPFFINKKTVGALSIYSIETFFFTNREIELLDTIGSNISFALDLFEKDKAKEVAEKALLESEKRFSEIILKAPSVAIQGYSKNAEVLYWNKASEKLYGFKQEDAIGKTTDLLMLDQDSSEYFKATLEILDKTGLPPEPTTWIVKDKNGIEKMVYSSIFSIPSIKGEKEYVCMDVDISDRINAEKALKESEAKFRTLAESSPFGIGIYQNNNLIYGNMAFQNICEYSQEEFSKMNFWDLVHPDHREMVKEKGLARQKGLLRPETYEFKVITKSGKTKWVLFSGDLIEYLGKPAGIITVIDINDSKLAVEALKISEEKNNALINAIPDIIFIIKSDGTFIDYKAENTSELLLPPVEFIGKKVTEVLPENLAKIMLQHIDLALKTSGTVQYEYSLDTPEVNYFEARMVKSGEDQVLSIIRNITSRKNFEDKILKSEKKFRDLAELLPQTVYECDRKGNLIFVNKYAYKMSGYSQQDFENGLNILQYVSSTDHNRVKHSFADILSGNNSSYTEYTLIRKDGSSFLANVYSALVYKNNEIVGSRGIIVDISEQKKAEERIRKQDVQIQRITDNMHELFGELDNAGKIKYINPAVKTIFGYEQQEIIGTNLFDGIHADEINYVKSVFERITVSGKGASIFRFKNKEDNYIWSEFSVSSFTDEYNLENGFIFNWRDITLRKQAEELRKKIEDTEYQNLVKSKFLANLSHEIRNPLNSIIGFSNTLEQSSLSEEQQKHLKYIKISSQNLMHVLNDILDFSKIEANKIEVNNEEIDLNELLDEVYLMSENKADEKNLTLDFIIETNVPRGIMTDGNKLKQILYNLLGNSIKFTENGKVGLKLNAKLKVNNMAELIFKIYDTGIGIKKENFYLIFQSFTQLDSSMKKQHAGTGLGLAITKNYVELLGGTISFESEYQKGSEFSFIIPVEITNKKTIKQNASNQKNKMLAPKKLTVLLAEDDALNRMYLVSFLKKQGWTIDTAINGFEVLDKFKKNDYDIILMDGQMPGMDGFEAATKIRKLNKGANIPIIVITGYTLNENSEQFIAAGMNDFVIKPIIENELIGKINKLVK